MNNVSLRKNKASICYKNICVNTTGQLAKVITVSVAISFIAISIAALLNTSKN